MLFPELDRPENVRRCLRCGRWLKTSRALRLGLGSTCERKERAERPATLQEIPNAHLHP